MRIEGVEIQVVHGDITGQGDIDIIVNAANSGLQGGGGVDGAIHRAAGPELKKESAALAPINPGQAVITGAYRLPNRFVVHCVGPVYGVHKPEDELLAKCYSNALRLAEKQRAASIAFPAISTGVYGYPMREAAQVMFKTIMEQLPELEHIKLIRVVLFDRLACELHRQVLNKVKGK